MHQARKNLDEQLRATFELVADTYTRSAFLLGVSAGWLLSDLSPDVVPDEKVES